MQEYADRSGALRAMVDPRCRLVLIRGKDDSDWRDRTMGVRSYDASGEAIVIARLRRVIRTTASGEEKRVRRALEQAQLVPNPS